MERDASRQILLHHAVSTIGGFLGGYAIFNHCDIFGNAQTANLIHLVCKIFSADFAGLIFLVLALLSYVAGNVFCVIAEKFIRYDIRLISLALTSCAVVVIGAFPNVSNHYIAVLPILFVMPIQWNAYRTAGGYVSATIFSTNNIRMAVMSLTRYIIDRDKKQALQARFYWITLLSFHTGVAFSCVASVFLGTMSVWFCFVPIALSVGAYMWLKERRIKRLVVRYILKRAKKHKIYIN